MRDATTLSGSLGGKVIEFGNTKSGGSENGSSGAGDEYARRE
jgi:hypothetical protein